MISTIVFGVSFITLIVVLILFFKTGSWTFEALSIGFGAITAYLGIVFAVSIGSGYCERVHPVPKEVIIECYKNPVTKIEAIQMIKEWNVEERRFNDYWCRFTLREPDLIEMEKL